MRPMITFDSMTNQANLMFVIHLNHICPDLSLERMHNYPICLGTNTTFVSWINMDKYEKYHICSMFEPYLSLVKSVFSPSVFTSHAVLLIHLQIRQTETRQKTILQYLHTELYQISYRKVWDGKVT